MSKMINRALMAGAALMAMSAVPGMANAQAANGITNCDAPGGRQQAGAVIGGVLGALAGSQISDNERELGAVAGAAAGAAAGSYSAGQSVQATGSQGEWVRLSNGGWVSAHYLTY
jgi:hypothetical protein